MNWLIDTNVISETRKPKPNVAVLGWLQTLALRQVLTSSLNIAELVSGASLVGNFSKKLDLEQWIETIVRPWFIGRIVEIDEDVLVRWRLLTRQQDRAGKPAPSPDLLIAAVAQKHRLAVATRDIAPFVDCGIPTLNPWTGERFNGA
jgi:toxin FitB